MNLTIQQALQNGIKAHKAGRLQEAERFYRAILQSQPLHPDANHNLGLLAVSVNKADIAVPLFKIALEANPKTEQYWLSYIDALIRNRQFKHAKQVIDQGRANHVAEEKLGILEAHLASTTEVRKPELAEQEKHSKKKQQKIKVSGPTRQQLDTLLKHYQSGFFAEAEELAISITQAFPNHQFGWKVLGAVLKSTGRVADSLAAMKKSVDLAPRDADAHNNYGATLVELRRYDEAEKSYKHAIALNSKVAEVHSNLGNVLRKLGKIDEAETSYKNAIALKPENAEVYYNLGIALKEMGRLDEAQMRYIRAIELRPGHAEAHNNLGVTLNELGRLDEAVKCYSRAIELKPAFVDAFYNLATTLTRLGKLDKAEDICRQAIKLMPGHDGAHRNLGEILLKKGRHLEGLNEKLIGAGAISFDLKNGLTILQ